MCSCTESKPLQWRKCNHQLAHRLQLNINQSDGYLANLVRMDRFRRHLANMALKVSLKYYVWTSSLHTLAFTVNPHFIYQYNEVYVPPGSLQFPIYSLTSEPFLNLAGLGSLFGEEAVGAIDEHGENGRLSMIMI